MFRIYALIIVIGLLGGVGYAAKSYYTSTQNTIATLRTNNAQLEVAAQTAQTSVETLQADIAKMATLNKSLQEDLQKAEAYGDELRSKLSKLNLVVEALKDSKSLEGKMNGATAKLWREFMGDTGNNDGGQSPLPKWLQQPDARATSESGDSDTKGTDTSSSETEASKPK